MDADDELIQVAERQLAEAEAAFRQDPTAANQRWILRSWDAVRKARGEPHPGPDDLPWQGHASPQRRD